MMGDHNLAEDHPASIRDTQAAGLSSEPGLEPVEPGLVSWTTGIGGPGSVRKMRP